MPKGVSKIIYSGEFKQQAVEFMRENNLSCRDAAAKFGISKSMINRWERTYLEEGVESLYIVRRVQASKSVNPRIGRPPVMPKQVEEDLIAENQRLRMENEYLKKLNALIREKEVSMRKTKLK
ncbi:MAG: helix-turn-helix protein [Clostridia bacterium]|jgi:transposase|nr:helix-turn-helix protein [Clostridia bacterium]